MMVLACRVSNNNITTPITQTIAIDLNCRIYSLKLIITYCTLLIVKPKEAKIITPITTIHANAPHEFVCQSMGSKPASKIFWYIGENQMESIGESVPEDGWITTSFLSFVPSFEDNNKELRCSSTNPKFPGLSVENSLILHVVVSI